MRSERLMMIDPQRREAVLQNIIARERAQRLQAQADHEDLKRKLHAARAERDHLLDETRTLHQDYHNLIEVIEAFLELLDPAGDCLWCPARLGEEHTPQCYMGRAARLVAQYRREGRYSGATGRGNETSYTDNS
jgi:hypothetical protein